MGNSKQVATNYRCNVRRPEYKYNTLLYYRNRQKAISFQQAEFINIALKFQLFEYQYIVQYKLLH